MQNWSWAKSVQKSNKNQFGESLGLYLGRVWGHRGPPLNAFGQLLVAFWSFKIELLSSIGLKWAPRGLLDGFWVALGGFWEGFGRIWKEILEDFGTSLALLQRHWSLYKNGTPALPRSAPRSVTIFLGVVFLQIFLCASRLNKCMEDP